MYGLVFHLALALAKKVAAAESFATSAPLVTLEQETTGDLGESQTTTEAPTLAPTQAPTTRAPTTRAPTNRPTRAPTAFVMVPAGCDAFYAKHSDPSASEPRKIESPGPSRRKLLQEDSKNANPAEDATQLRQRITEYVDSMAIRASGVATAQLKLIQQRLSAAREDLKKINIGVKNAVSMVNQEKLRTGTEQGLATGSCVSTSCYIGVTFKDTEAGEPVTWTCRRGVDLKDKVRLSFTCSVDLQPGMPDEKLVMCAGKEVHFGDYIEWVPFIKETSCPHDIDQPCAESKQCGSDRLPLRKAFVQKRLRNECAQL